MSNFNFKLIVIESLPPDDFKSGKELYGFLIGLTSDDIRESPANLLSVSNADGFRKVILNLTEDALGKRENYILHIETHGLNDMSGILFADRSCIYWDELCLLFVPLNRATHFNLLICVAACFGGTFLTEIKPYMPAPCWGIIGPTDNTNGPELLNRFRTFYTRMFQRSDSTIDVETLLNRSLENGYFVVRTVDDWFQSLVADYFKNNCNKDSIEKRVISIKKRVALDHGINAPMLMIKEQFNEHISTFFDECFQIFFMTTEVPENLTRYRDLLSSGKQEINIFLKAQNF